MAWPTCINAVAAQEMLHFGFACNMLSAIAGSPSIANVNFVPSYPGLGLPGASRGFWWICRRSFSPLNQVALAGIKTALTVDPLTGILSVADAVNATDEIKD